MTKRISFLLLTLIILLLPTSFSKKNAYRIFDKQGKEVNYKKLLKEACQADIVLFGELHNDPISHWLELSLLKDLYSLKGGSMMVGAEMFETDDQDLLDKYSKGEVPFSEVEKGVELWNNYATDYKPILEYSIQNKIPFYGTNIPRKYARLVARKGMPSLDSLSNQEKEYFPPLPIEIDLELPGYKNMAKEGIHGNSMWNTMYMAEAQAVKDATMAHTILSKWKKGNLFFHINGAYHSDNFEGIYWYLKRNNKDLQIVTISTVEQENVKKLDVMSKGKADFILAVPEDMTKTY